MITVIDASRLLLPTLLLAVLHGGCGGGQELGPTSSSAKPDGTFLLVGRVTSSKGHPIGGARVAVYPPGRLRAQHLVVTGADGRFTTTVAEGVYALTATAVGHTAAFLAKHDFREGSAPVTLTLEQAHHVVRGTVREGPGRPVPNVVVRASQGLAETQLFYTQTDRNGRYEIGLPESEYTVTAEPGQYITLDGYFGGGHTQVDLHAYSRRIISQPAPESVVDWIRSHVIPLKTVIAGNGFEDLRSLKPLIGDARIVGLGEQTHGSREFFQAKHRLIEFLVTELGFSVFAIEASLPDAMAVNDYILHGRGSAATALAGMRFWIWDTEEVLEMIEWMRRYNANPAHGRKLRFYGFDMQYSSAAVAGVLAYVAQSTPRHLDSVRADLTLFSTEDWKGNFAEMAAEAQAAARRRVENVARLLDENRHETEAWERARRYVTVILQLVEMIAPTSQPPQPRTDDRRDPAMADNVAWIARRHPQARIVLWTHNVHISRRDFGGVPAMGRYLAAEFGGRYLALGLTFGTGAYQARDVRLGREAAPVIEHPVERPPNYHVEATLARVGLPLFVVDLRNRPRTGPVADWFEMPHPLREYGSVHRAPDFPWAHYLVDRQFDALLYVDRTTRARPTPTGRRDK